jgi:hypothetical protein
MVHFLAALWRRPLTPNGPEPRAHPGPGAGACRRICRAAAEDAAMRETRAAGNSDDQKSGP